MYRSVRSNHERRQLVTTEKPFKPAEYFFAEVNVEVVTVPKGAKAKYTTAKT